MCILHQCVRGSLVAFRPLPLVDTSSSLSTGNVFLQAMARSHRIGQTRKVKVFRLVTRSTYESEMVERANKKLGLERAMNADRANDGLKEGKDGKYGPPQDRGEIDAMLKRGAHDIFMNDVPAPPPASPPHPAQRPLCTWLPLLSVHGGSLCELSILLAHPLFAGWRMQ